MRGSITTFTGIVFLAHALLGCCWHHAEECAGCGAWCSLASHAFGDDCCGDRAGVSGAPTEHSCPCHLECAGVCVYVPPEKVPLPAPLAAAVMEAGPSLFQPLPADRGQLASPRHFCDAPLRVHLLHQVLVI